MKPVDFSDLFYHVINTYISNINADVSPVVRVQGMDRSSGFSTAFTALGSRFDVDYAQEEAFLHTDTYESDFRAVDRIRVAESMRYIRQQAIADDKLYDKYRLLVDEVKANNNIYGSKRMKNVNDKGEILFIPGPASALDEANEERYGKLANEVGKAYRIVTDFNDCGYLMLELGLAEEINALREEIRPIVEEAELVVTEDSYVLDALLVLFPEASNKIYFIDEFIAEYANGMFEGFDKDVVLHESGVINRLYPERKVNYPFATRLPNRSGFDVTDSGIAGGLGLFEPVDQVAVGKRRVDELIETGVKVILTPCASEAYGLRKSIEDQTDDIKIVTLLEALV